MTKLTWSILAAFITLGFTGSPTLAEQTEIATFAGGCFWCMEPPFEKLDGVKSVTSGYTGGTEMNPTYEEVSAGETGHAEAVQIVFDPEKVSYEELLEVYWQNIDPFAVDRQFCDVGKQYRSAIYYHSARQKRLAEAFKLRIQEKHKAKVETQLEPAGEFYPAEEYHQDYYKKNPIRYRVYRLACRRDARLEELWGKD